MAASIESAALVVLLRAGERPWQQYAELVEEAGSALAVLERERDETSRLFHTGGSDTELAPVVAEIARWEAQGMELVTVLDPAYPANLRAVHDRPPLIFVAGHYERADARALAVIGSRQATRRGLSAAVVLADHLVHAGYTVVSGLAAGIDTAAHEAALRAGGRSLAVIGTGLGRAYPPQNGPLQRRLIHSGAVISQFWPGAPPTRRSFPMRNGVMSGLSLGTVIVEASVNSGTRVQARLALAHGRPVFLRRPLLEQAWARELAARPGVYVASSPEEITAAIERLDASGALVP